MSDSLVSFIQAFTIEFFGSLLPGVLLLVGIYAGILYPMSLFQSCSVVPDAVFCDVLARLEGQSGTTLGAVLSLGTAYLIGLSYAKRSVAWADSASYYYGETVVVSRHAHRASPVKRPALLPRPPTQFWSCRHAGAYLYFEFWIGLCFALGIPVRHMPCLEFPYGDLQEYLRRIGLAHIAEHVGWTSDPSLRSQRRRGMDLENFNAIKTRIEIKSAEAYRPVAQFEAQNRLLASMYSVTTHLLLLMIVVWFGTWVTGAEFQFGRPDASFWLVPLPTVGVLCLLRHRVLLTLHKERVREVIRVFETADRLGVLDVGDLPRSRFPFWSR